MLTIFSIIVLGVFFLGWLYFPIQHFIKGGLIAPFWSIGKVAAIVVLLSMYAVMYFTEWTNPIPLWLSSPWVINRRIFWAVWAIYGLPLWATAIVLFPHVLRDAIRKPQLTLYQPMPSEPFAIFGWLLLFFSYIALLAFKT